MKVSRAPIAAILLSPVLFPCATDDSPRFVPRNLPEQVDKQFVRGKLGILNTTLNDKYQFIAWRWLSGMPLSADEQSAAAAPVNYPLSDAVANWQKTVAPAMVIQAKLSKVAPNEFYLNCLDDAFATAQATLADRKQRYGSDAPVRTWLAAQNQVFANCSGQNPVYPPDPDASLQGLARADRMYQIAAAHFYAEDFDGARQRFEAIAADASSPWQGTAKYMVARVYLREATLLKRVQEESSAQAQLAKVAADSSAGRFQDAARRLMGYTDSLRDPANTVTAAARQLSASGSEADLARAFDLGSYVLEAPRFRPSLANADLPAPFDWIRAVRQPDTAYAVKRWGETHSDLWLVAAVMNSKGKDADTPALLGAARQVPESSPAYDTVTYHAVRLTIEAGHEDTARAMLDRLLAGKPRDLVSVDNALRGERMSLATSFDDFLRWAPRQPIGFGDESLDASMGPGRFDKSRVLGEDSVRVVNALPLAKLAEAAESKRIPAWNAADVALIGMTRALMLQNAATAMRLIPIVSAAHPAWAGDLKIYRDAAGDAKRFAADLLIARHPEFRIELYPEFRTSADEESSWWCAARPVEGNPNPLAVLILSESELHDAAQQRQQMASLGTAQAFIAPSAMAWAQAHTGDPRVPESLYRIVRMTRYGCRGAKDNGAISKAAFDLLHGKYPDTDWAKKTPYWFKD